MSSVYGTVASIVDLGPRIRRIVFDVPLLADLHLPGRGDDAVGIYFDPAETDEGRNYSIRRLDARLREITCDFVLHQRGLASDWARRVRVGEQVRLDHGRGWYQPQATATWQLLIADLSGLPALARILEELPDGIDASVIVEVAEQSDLTYLPARQGISVTATVGTGNGDAPSRLAHMVRSHVHPDGLGYCWFAGEAKATREVRKHLRNDYRWGADQYDIVGYWRFDSETWDRRYAAVSDEMAAVHARALADGKDEKTASEEYDLALEGIGL